MGLRKVEDGSGPFMFVLTDLGAVFPKLSKALEFLVLGGGGAFGIR